MTKHASYIKCSVLLASFLFASIIFGFIEAKDPTKPGNVLAKKYGCLTCHKQNGKLIGPDYDSIYKKYKDDKQATQKLIEKIKKGGKGNWGQIPMPPNPLIPDEDLTSLVKWILKDTKINNKPDPEAIVVKLGCVACHKVDTKVVGPAYNNVAQKYKKDKAATEKLIKKIKLGGKGVWGEIPMPPNPKASDKDLQIVVDWILNLKKPAIDATPLVKKHACIACHQVDKKLVGPSYKAVAKKYKTDKDATGKLVKKIQKGGKGIWGEIPMPPSAAPEKDLRTIVEWILQLK